MISEKAETRIINYLDGISKDVQNVLVTVARLDEKTSGLEVRITAQENKKGVYLDQKMFYFMILIIVAFAGIKASDFSHLIN